MANIEAKVDVKMALKTGVTKLQPGHVIKSNLDQEAFYKAALSR